MVVKKRVHGAWNIKFGRRDLIRWRSVISAFEPLTVMPPYGWWNTLQMKNCGKDLSVSLPFVVAYALSKNCKTTRRG